jgi:hypothetical protein
MIAFSFWLCCCFGEEARIIRLACLFYENRLDLVQPFDCAHFRWQCKSHRIPYSKMPGRFRPAMFLFTSTSRMLACMQVPFGWTLRNNTNITRSDTRARRSSETRALTIPTLKCAYMITKTRWRQMLAHKSAQQLKKEKQEAIGSTHNLSTSLKKNDAGGQC